MGPRLVRRGRVWVLVVRGVDHELPRRASLDHADRLVLKLWKSL